MRKISLGELSEKFALEADKYHVDFVNGYGDRGDDDAGYNKVADIVRKGVDWRRKHLRRQTVVILAGGKTNNPNRSEAESLRKHFDRVLSGREVYVVLLDGVTETRTAFELLHNEVGEIRHMTAYFEASNALKGWVQMMRFYPNARSRWINFDQLGLFPLIGQLIFKGIPAALLTFVALYWDRARKFEIKRRELHIAKARTLWIKHQLKK